MTGLVLPRTTPHPPPTLSTRLGRASPLRESTTSSSGGRGLGGVLNGGSPPPYIALSKVDPSVNFQGGTPKNCHRERGGGLQEKTGPD